MNRASNPDAGLPNLDATSFFSVIVPSKSWTPDCDQCLASLRAQDYPKNRFEIIFVLDPCQEDYANQARTKASESDPCVRILFSDIAGISSAKNLGISESRGRYVAFTDSDARPYRDWLSRLEECAYRTKASVVGGRVVTDFGRILPPILYANTNLGPPPLRAIGANVMYDRSVVLGVGGFDEEFRRQEDYDLMLRIMAQDQTVVFCENAVVYHELDQFGISGLWKLSKGGQYFPLMFRRHPDWTRNWLKMKGRFTRMTIAFGCLLASSFLAWFLSLMLKSLYPLILPMFAFVAYCVAYARVSIPPGQKRSIRLLLLASMASLILAAFSILRTAYGSFKYRTLLL